MYVFPEGNTQAAYSRLHTRLQPAHLDTALRMAREDHV